MSDDQDITHPPNKVRTGLNTVLVALDGSPLGEVVLPYVEALSKLSGARIVLVQAAVTRPFKSTFPATPAMEAMRHSEEYLNEQARALKAQGLAVEIAVPYAEADDGILEEADRRHVDLIMMATHGRSGLGRWVYGSVVEKVLCRSSVPVLVVRSWQPQFEMTDSDGGPSILVPLDGSPFTEAALPAANRIAGALRGKLVLIRASDPSARPLSPILVQTRDTLSYLMEEVDITRAEAEAYLRDVAHGLSIHGHEAEIEARSGSTAEVITQIERERGASLVVMSTHGRTGVSRMVLGSVADTVLRQGTAPVMLMRPRPVEADPA